MKKLLVPTDFSIHAENALKIAAKLAKKNNYEIHLLHMLEIPSQMNDTISQGVAVPQIMAYLEQSKETLNKTAQHECLKGVKTLESIDFKTISDGILSYIKNYEIDLIIMGSNGTTGLDEILIGSNTEKIVRLSSVPVLVVKSDSFKFEKPNFIFASDFSDETKASFAKMIEFANTFDAKLNLVTICTPNSFKTTALAEKTMTDYVAAFDIKEYTTHIYNDTNIEKGILNFAKETNADLIGLCTHGRTGLVHFFTGSIGEDLANHAKRPVITFRI